MLDAIRCGAAVPRDRGVVPPGGRGAGRRRRSCTPACCRSALCLTPDPPENQCRLADSDLARQVILETDYCKSRLHRSSCG
jgi:hypothetical protein